MIPAIVLALALAQTPPSYPDCHLTVTAVAQAKVAGHVYITVEIRNALATDPVLEATTVQVDVASKTLTQVRDEIGGRICFAYRHRQALIAEAATKMGQIDGWSGTVQAVQR